MCTFIMINFTHQSKKGLFNTIILCQDTQSDNRVSVTTTCTHFLQFCDNVIVHSKNTSAFIDSD